MKRTSQKTARIDVVDFWRFFAAIMILLCHIDLIGGNDHHLEYFVEFFFFLTGFFIFKHFQKTPYFRQNIETRAKNALTYTWKRFVALMPYVIPIVAITSLVVFTIGYSQDHWTGNFVNNMRNVINEILLLPSGVMSHARIIGPVWYLSVMIFAMPLVSLIAQSRRLNLFVIAMLPITWLILQQPNLLTYYSVNSHFSFYRGLFAMSLGGVIYYLTKIISAKKVSDITRRFLTFLEISLYIYAAIIGYFNLKPVELCIVVLFFAALITLSGISLTSKLRTKLFNYAGAISLPLFMWHFGVIRIMVAAGIDFGARVNIILMAILSIFISAIHYQVVQKLIAQRAKKK